MIALSLEKRIPRFPISTKSSLTHTNNMFDGLGDIFATHQPSPLAAVTALPVQRFITALPHAIFHAAPQASPPIRTSYFRVPIPSRAILHNLSNQETQFDCHKYFQAPYVKESRRRDKSGPWGDRRLPRRFHPRQLLQSPQRFPWRSHLPLQPQVLYPLLLLRPPRAVR